MFDTDLFLIGTETPDEVRRLAHACNAPDAAAQPVLRLLEYLQAIWQAGELSQAAYEKIMWKNATRLLKHKT